MRIRILTGIILVYLILPVYLQADICSYVDADGVRHFSNGGDCPAESTNRNGEFENSDLRADQNSRGLRFMGVYKDGADYLRFYRDGTVVSGTTAAKPEQLAVWFGKSNKHLHKCRYGAESEDKIHFFCSDGQNDIFYQGAIKVDVLTVQLFICFKHQPIDKQFFPAGNREYRFLPLVFTRDNLY